MKLLKNKQERVDLKLKFFGKVFMSKGNLRFLSDIPKREANNETSSRKKTTVGDIMKINQIIRNIKEK